jgi:exodeoxyribonuclease-3
MKLATWNINSVRIRTHLLEQLVREQSPDILCLQEIKVEDALFPFAPLRAMGYEHIEISGQKGYHGVAILSRVPMTRVHRVQLLDREDKRHIAVTLPDGTELHNFYVPAGGNIPDRVENPYFGFKLDYVDAMREWFAAERKADRKMILVGDLNVAPHEHDVWSHRQLLKIVSHTPEETERLNALQADFGWCDAARHFVPKDQKLYSWWSYRNRDWRASNRGRRLDHIWVTPPLVGALKTVHTVADARDWERASDHVPVIVELNH